MDVRIMMRLMAVSSEEALTAVGDWRSPPDDDRLDKAIDRG